MSDTSRSTSAARPRQTSAARPKPEMPAAASSLAAKAAPPTSTSHAATGEYGSGTPSDPYRAPRRDEPNRSGCHHCPEDDCGCAAVTGLLRRAYASVPMKRRTEGTSRQFCAKSLLPPFVARLIREMRLSKDDTFIDLGCGNGSVILQVAMQTGARCIGVELCPHNAAVASEALRVLCAELPPHAIPRVDIIQGDLADLISATAFTDTPKKILCSNLLFPKSLTQYVAERCRALPVGSVIACFDDFYPHARSVAKVRDPDAFARFCMTDYVWPCDSVEWCRQEGRFYLHWRKPIASDDA